MVAVSTSRGNDVLIFSLAKQKPSAAIRDNEGIVSTICFPRDRDLVLAAGTDLLPRVFDLSGERDTVSIHSSRWTAPFTASACSSRDPDLGAVGDSEGQVSLCDLRGGRLGTFEEHDGAITCLRFSSFHDKLASGSIDRRVCVYSCSALRGPDHFKCLWKAKMPSEVHAVAWSPYGPSTIFVGCACG